MGVCDDGAGAEHGGDAGTGGADGGVSDDVYCAELDQHAVGVCNHQA